LLSGVATRNLAPLLSAAHGALLFAFLQPGMAGRLASDAMLGLPPPAQEERAAQRVALGRKLFMDRRLSGNGTMSCGTCHVPEQGFTANELRTAVGIEGRSLRRNAPTVLNAGYNRFLFHDGRETRLEEQAWGPLLAGDEMGNESRESVTARIAQLPDYAGRFDEAFPGRGLTPATIGAALAAYQRSLVSGGSRFDRWYFGGEDGALTAAERRGFVLFRGKAHCDACHTLGRDHALFTDDAFHNIGVGLASADRAAAEVGAVLAPGVSTKVSVGPLEKPFGAAAPDQGRYEVTGLAKDRFAYRTPTLRNVELTAPYMHDGSAATLRDVVDFYDRGGNVNPALDPLMMPLFLSEREKDDLVAFMRSLTGANVERLAAEARAAAAAPSLR
jgi:cytochrome c peroxidase